MGLFGSPSKELIQEFHDSLIVVVPESDLAIRRRHAKLLQPKADRYDFQALVSPIDLDIQTQLAGWQFEELTRGAADDSTLSVARICERDLSIDSLLLVLPEVPLAGRLGELNTHSVQVDIGQCVTLADFGEDLEFLRLADACTADLSIDSLTGWIDPNDFLAASRSLDLELPIAEVDTHEIASIEVSWMSSPTELGIVPRTCPSKFALLSETDFRVRIVEGLRFSARVTEFKFPPPRKEDGLVPVKNHRQRRRPSVRIKPISPPAPPPSLNEAALEERLWWILNPPIHEVLADPEIVLAEKPYPYQTFGFKWLCDRDSALLADEMGLGKTAQAIVAARLLWRDQRINHILIVCPKSLVSTWQRQLEEWWPDSVWRTKVIEGDRQWFLRLATKEAAIKIINYESLSREFDWLKENPQHHDLVIIDEAQRIKNPKSKISQAVKALRSNRRWALTGTPLENSQNDLISICDFVRPGLLRMTDSIVQIRTKIKPYMLRRKQEEVASDLPQKIEQDVDIELGTRQRRAYDLAWRKRLELNAIGDRITLPHVLAVLARLRQVCNFDLESGESAKAERLLEELEEVLANGHKALVFGQFVHKQYGLQKLAAVLRESKIFGKQFRVLELHGESSDDRDLTIRRFEEDPRSAVLLLNYKVGGVGLNLQVANYVYLFERWWNPAVEEQAIKRCHRLGQAKKVFVKRFYCRDTIEEHILKILAKKRRLFDRVIDGGDPMTTLGLSEEEIYELLDLSVRPKSKSKAESIPKVNLDDSDPNSFRNLIALIYEKEGYTVEESEDQDLGMDLIAERSNKAGTERILIQCRHQKQNVGKQTLQGFWRLARSDGNTTRSEAITSAGFTLDAQEFAREVGMTLVDRGKLQERAYKLGVAEFVDPA